jgi:RsiW-degrading membrane proteinase PrsW (M82 family)
VPFCTHCGNKILVGTPACPACNYPVWNPAAQWNAGASTTPVPPVTGAPTVPGAVQPPWPPYAPPETGLEHLLDDIRSFQLKWIVPFDTALSPKILENRSVWLMLIFGFFPLAVLSLGLVQTVQGLIFALLAYYCMAWGGYFYYFVCKSSVDFWVGVGSMAFTVFIGVPFLRIVETLPGISDVLLWTRASDPLWQILGYVAGVGPLEELTKALPVLLLAYGFGKVTKPLDGIFYGAMSGLGFAVVEGSLYVSHSELNVPVQAFIRTTTLPFMHALWAATSGYFISLALINKRRGVALVLLGIAVPAVHHGLYDSFSGTPLGLLLAAFIYLLFVAYMERSQNMVAELEQAERLAEQQARVQQMYWHAYGVAPPVAPGAVTKVPPAGPGPTAPKE